MDRNDVINKVFPHSLFGYDPVAVDAFLDEVIREFDRLNNTIDVLRLKIEQELSEAQDTNLMLTTELSKEGFLKRAAEHAAIGTPAEESAPETVSAAETEVVAVETPAEVPAVNEGAAEPSGGTGEITSEEEPEFI